MSRTWTAFIPLIVIGLAVLPLVLFLPELTSELKGFFSQGSSQSVESLSQSEMGSENPAEPEYPVRMELKNMDGKSLRVILLGRSKTRIQFIREDDRSEHIYAMKHLDPLARKQVLAYPVTGIAIKDAEEVLQQLSRDEVYIEQLRAKNGELEHEIELLKLKKNSTNKDEIKLRVKELQERIKRNELSIKKKEFCLN